MGNDMKQLWHVRLVIGDNGDLLRGICYGRERKRYKLKAVVSHDEFSEKRVMLYRMEGKNHLFLAGYDYYRNAPDVQWIDISGGRFVNIRICNMGSISLDVYYDYPGNNVLFQPKEEVCL